jgi:hypothetical protein
MRRACLVLSLLVGCNKGTDTPVDTDVEQPCTDADSDGVCVEDGDCDDTNPIVHPGGPDVPYNGRDDDCDGSDLTDVDGDGFDGPSATGPDCNDSNPEINPGVPEICYQNTDYNCDGELLLDDCDTDGFVKTEDCNDRDASVYPGADDPWYDGVDENCDRASDYDQDADGDDRAGDGGGDCNDTDATIASNAIEAWDGIDQDCDGVDLLFNGDAWKNYDGALNDGAWTSTIVIVGDIDGDGLSDVFATDVLKDGANGGAYLISTGAVDGRTDQVEVCDIVGTGSKDLFGWDADIAGDLDGDGLLDVMVGAPGVDDPDYAFGAAFVFLGSDLANGGHNTSSTAQAELIGGPLAGLSVGGLGDLDGDGLDELAVGQNYLGLIDIVVYPGAAVAAGGQLMPDVDASARIVDNLGLGGALLGRTDLDQDGTPDVVIGRTTPPFECYGYCTRTSGATLIPGDAFTGLAMLDLADWPTVAGAAEGGLGATMGLLDDVDQDGYPELVVADPFAAALDGNPYGGEVYVVDGDAFADADVASVAMFTVSSEVPGGFLRVNRRNGDATGDGLDELFVGEPGNVDVYSASTGMPFATTGDGGVHVFLGDVVAAGGDVSVADAPTSFTSDVSQRTFGMSFDVGVLDGDSRADVAIGAPFYGYGKMFLYTSAY